MLIKQLIRETLELQGFRIESVEKKDSELLVTIEPDLRYHPRCGVCGLPGDYRDTLPKRHFRHVPHLGNRRESGLFSMPGQLLTVWRHPC